ncbi:MAG: hypothetical protein HYX92_21090 [Chloroflexi bacterium]|nr:hypothetical protein [Chloroflexota bacterium]
MEPASTTQPAARAVKEAPNAAGPVTLELYDPTGAFDVPEVHAPRLDTLGGKTICELSNGVWEADRTFSLMREALRKGFPDVRTIPYTEFPIGNDEIDIDDISEIVKRKGCQAVIVGNAG